MTATQRATELAQAAGAAAQDKLAEEVLGLDVSDMALPFPHPSGPECRLRVTASVRTGFTFVNGCARGARDRASKAPAAHDGARPPL